MKLLFRYSDGIVFAVIILVCIASVLAVSLPNSLLPSLSQPQMSLSLQWPGKTINDVEKTLVAPLENQLETIPFLSEVRSEIHAGGFYVTLIFNNSADMEQAYIDVLSRLNQIPDWPSDVSTPTITNFSSGGGSTLASFFLYSESGAFDEELGRVFEQYVKPEFIKVKGVSLLDASRTSPARRVDVIFEPGKLAQYGLRITDIERRMKELVDHSGGHITLGSQDYAVNLRGSVELPELEKVLIDAKGRQLVRLGDLAKIEVGHAYDWDYIALNGIRSLYFVVKPSREVNALQTIEALKKLSWKLNRGVLSKYNMALAISRDDSKAIKNSLALVFGSLAAGIFLAAMVLALFISKKRFVLLLIVSIPVSLAFVLVVLSLSGRSFNVISLAGMALSIGLILDAGIVVIESVVKRFAAGENATDCVVEGTREVRPAIISSTLSSIVVFIPMMSINSVEGQLIKDLAIVISSALFASIFFALMLCPLLLRMILRGCAERSNLTRSGLSGAKQVAYMKKLIGQKKLTRILGLGAIPLAIVASMICVPPMDILPNPKQNIVSTVLTFERPQAVAAVREGYAALLQKRIASRNRATAPEYGVSGLFCFTTYCLLYFYPEDGFDFSAFKRWVDSDIVKDLVGVNSHTFQGGLLRLAMPESRTGFIDLKGADSATLRQIGWQLVNSLREAFPNGGFREVSPMKDTKAQVDIRVRDDYLAYTDLRQSDVHKYLMALTDGLYLGNFYADGSSLPYYLKSAHFDSIERLLQTEVLLPNHQFAAVRDFVELELRAVANSKFRVNSELSVTFSVNPPGGVPIGPFFDKVKMHIDRELKDLPNKGVYVNFRGSADRLSVFMKDFYTILLFSVFILSATVWMVLHSIRDTLISVLSLLPPVCGGFVSLALLRIVVPQNLDVITLMGFVILIGIAVNNVILIAAKRQAELAGGVQPDEAIIKAIQTRLRPIYMSCLTSVFGMLPLLLSPAASSEIYRGLAAVLVGGLTVSMLATPYLMIALFSLAQSLEGRFHRHRLYAIVATTAGLFKK